VKAKAKVQVRATVTVMESEFRSAMELGCPWVSASDWEWHWV
jgi:hypothetical protein